jgi:23S rRNA G2069 N7-methylase RlmK/C1962 C5-methylase RlmI
MLAKAKLVLEYVYKSGAHATWGVDQQNRARKAASLNQSLNFVNVIVL